MLYFLVHWSRHCYFFYQVDGMIHANLFVQAHSEIVLILLAKCDLYQNEDAVRSLVRKYCNRSVQSW
jgi:hypothetical protein